MPAESLTDVMADLRQQITSLSDATSSVRHQVKSLFRRAKHETVVWMEEPLTPRTAAVRRWCAENDLPETPTLNAFLDTLFSKKKTTLDVETRMLTVAAADAAALFQGRRQITVFELLTVLPTLFL